MQVRRGLRSSVYDDGVRVYHDTRREELIPDACRDRVCRACTGDPPPHLRRALRALSNPTCVSIECLAVACGVKVSTAWMYATRVVECWPAAYDVARRLIYQPLLVALEDVDDLTGTLSEVMRRLEDGSEIRGDYEFRSMEDRYAHLRLARVVVQAGAEERARSKKTKLSPRSKRRLVAS